MPHREGAEDTAWAAHVNRAREILDDPSRLGRPPKDLVEVLALSAAGGLATTGLRALLRTCEGEHLETDLDVRDAAGAIGWALRYQFNLPEVTAMIRGMNEDEPYWRRVLEYCCHGCLQSVLDEYLHVLHDAQALQGKPPEESAPALAQSITEAATIRASQPRVDDIQASEDSAISLQSHVTRSRFALRFGDDHAEQESSRVRKEHVRAAFNSPFWPFVLATTSIGQEGLDFHQYCHAVVHWNLPGNPVDLEQREGRVHRYKGHAVRKNVARDYLSAAARGKRTDDHVRALLARLTAYRQHVGAARIMGRSGVSRAAANRPVCNRSSAAANGGPLSGPGFRDRLGRWATGFGSSDHSRQRLGRISLPGRDCCCRCFRRCSHHVDLATWRR